MNFAPSPPTVEAYIATIRRLIVDVRACAYIAVSARVVGGGIVTVRRGSRGDLGASIIVAEGVPELDRVDGVPVTVKQVSAAKLNELLNWRLS